MASQWMKARQTQYSMYATGYIGVVLAILVIVNFLANRHNQSFDYTANKRYTLSEQSQKLVRNLQQEMKITLYDRAQRLPNAKELLDQYDNLSPKLTVEYVDVEKSPQLARMAGISNLGQLLVEFNGRKEEARAMTEEEITGAMIRLTKPGERRVCFLSGSGEPELDGMTGDGLAKAKEALGKASFKAESITLFSKAEVPANCSILAVVGPRNEYLEPVVNAVQSYVEKGGKAMFLLGPPTKGEKFDISANPKLVGVLASWGIALPEELVLDASGIGQVFGYNMFVPIVQRYGSHPIVQGFREATAFPIARPVAASEGGKASAVVFANTMNDSFAIKTMDLSKLQGDVRPDRKGPVGLAAAVRFDTGKTPEGGTTKQEARVVVFGSSEWVTNSIFSFNGNRNLFLNTLSWLATDEELISVRPKDPEDRRLNVTPSQGWLFTVASFGPAIFVVCAGVYVWLKRR